MLKSILAAFNTRYHRAFKAIARIAANTYMRHAKRIEHITPEHVNNVAQQLEATLVMSEDLEADQLLTIQVSNTELASFVAYMRELDSQYRKLVDSYEYVAGQLKQEKMHGSEKPEAFAQAGAYGNALETGRASAVTAQALNANQRAVNESRQRP